MKSPFHAPSPFLMIFVSFLMVPVSVGALSYSVIASSQIHEERLEQAQREANGNQAMIFAVCRAFHRRDLFEEERIKNIKKVEFQYQPMVKPFSPIVKNYFKARRKLIQNSAAVVEKDFVNFDCLKGMKKAYEEGYHNSSPVTGKPIPFSSAVAIPTVPKGKSHNAKRTTSGATSHGPQSAFPKRDRTGM